MTSYLNKTEEKAVPCCNFVISGMQIDFLFEKVLILCASVCMIY